MSSRTREPLFAVIM